MRDRLALDRGRLLVAEAAERLQQLGAQAESVEPVVFGSVNLLVATVSWSVMTVELSLVNVQR